MMNRKITWPLLGLAGALTLLTGIAIADIEGSKHDFSHEDWSDGDKCGACHTPHRTKEPKTAPLWNAQADLSRRFGTTDPRPERVSRSDHSGESFVTGRRRLAGRRQDPGAGTVNCLRCHDGAMASDMIPTERVINSRNTFHAGRRMTGHGTSNHPVGVAYPGFDRYYHPQTRVVGGQAVTLPGGYVECNSCHDPHNHENVKYMLVMSNSGSALCLTCHRK